MFNRATNDQNIEFSLRESLLDQEERKEVCIDIPSHPVDPLIEAEKKLNLCVAIMKSHLRKKKTISALPNVIPSSISIGSIIGSTYYFVSSTKIFDQAFDQYDSTIQVNPYGLINLPPKFCNELYAFDIGYARSFYRTWLTTSSCNEYVDTMNTFRNFACANTFANVCNSPGMWPYSTSVVSIFGIGIPALIVLGSLVNQFGKRAMHRLFDLEEKIETIKIYAEKYEIKILDGMQIDEVINLFSKKLAEIKEAKNIHLSREVFVMGSKEPKSPINLLFNPATGGDANLAKLIFKFAGAYEGAEATLAQRKAFLDATHTKNSAYKVHAFFTKLNKRDANNDPIYDKEKIVSTIFSFAEHESLVKKYNRS